MMKRNVIANCSAYLCGRRIQPLRSTLCANNSASVATPDQIPVVLATTSSLNSADSDYGRVNGFSYKASCDREMPSASSATWSPGPNS